MFTAWLNYVFNLDFTEDRKPVRDYILALIKVFDLSGGMQGLISVEGSR